MPRTVSPNAALSAARRIEKELVDTRRAIHARPELGFEETETCRLVTQRLAGLGLKPRILAGTGVTALIESKQPGRVLMLRADMDALPIVEETGLPFASKNPGTMHACGHDFHTSILLGTARLLAEKPPEKGTVKLNFQPAEEGLHGATGMIEAGIMQKPNVDTAFGYHIWQGIPVGQVGVVSGPAMAAVDKFTINIHGVGGHAAYPHKSIDPVLIAAQVVTALQSITSRSINPLDSVVLTVASIHGGTAFNIIPPSVEMRGTVRSFSKSVRREVPKRMSTIVRQMASALGGRGELEYINEDPALVNDPKLADFFRTVIKDVVGKRSLIETEPSMGGEDMAFYQAMVPGCYIFIGSGPKGPVYPHHHPMFNPDEGVLPIAAAIMTEATRRWLAAN
ncbi:MAG: M20 family metallopeptidase [Candidatus Eisenbacteria bacterium]|nr:M20 family metallopeptidase [Candidatus Eisenbacteria bacterium]